MNKDKIVSLLHKVREVNPLIHNITNTVVTNFTANGLLAFGASPVMADSRKEVADMVKIANALLINIGTLNEHTVEAMHIAGRAANQNQVPVLLDPVGAGATPYRTETAQSLIQEIQFTAIRGNPAEIASVAGEKLIVKGVDGGELKGSILELAATSARKFNTTVVVTGKDDIVSDGETSYIVRNGHPILTKVTGTGCLLTAIIATFIAVESNVVDACVAALSVYGVAAELAAEKTAHLGPGSFQIEFLNKLATISDNDIQSFCKVEKIN